MSTSVDHQDQVDTPQMSFPEEKNVKDIEQERYQDEQDGGWSLGLVWIMGVAYLIIPAMSYSIASLNSPSELLKEFMNQTETDRSGQPMSESQIESMFGLLVAVVAIGGLIGSMVSDALADRIGRKYSIFLSAAIGTCGILVMILCKTAKAYEMLFVGRTIAGLALGLGLTLAPPYIMEMCHPRQKGAAAMANMVCQSTAIFVGQVLGYEELLGNRDRWVYLIGFPLVLTCVQLVLLPFCPHNPRFLLIKKQDEDGAIKALQTVRGYKNVENDIRQLRREMTESEHDAQVSVGKLFLTPGLRRPLITAIAMGLHQNWCGMNGVLIFSASLFEDAGIDGAQAKYATSGVGAVLVVGTLLAVVLLNHIGRKTLFLLGNTAIGLFSAVFALTMVFKEEVTELKYVNIAVSLLIMFSFAIGPVSVFWVILGEMFPHSARGAGFSVAIVCVFIGFFSHCYALPAMLATMSSYTFFVFAGIDAAMVVLCLMLMPETKDKSFAEIAASWTKPGDLELSGMDSGMKLNMSFVVAPSPTDSDREENTSTTHVGLTVAKEDIGQGEATQSEDTLPSNSTRM